MKQYWQQAVNKIDALSLRERAIVFVLASVIIISLFTLLIFDRHHAQIKLLAGRITTAETSIEQARLNLRQALINYQDPDFENREKLKTLQQELPSVQGTLVEFQKGLVSPERMPLLLQEIVKPDTGLRLVSLRTLPVQSLMATGMKEMAPTNATSAIAAVSEILAAPDTAMVYTHGVEIVIEGSYLQLLDYVKQLEGMPWQLIWAKAGLEVNEYPSSTLTLVIYSLSLDKKWLHL